MIKELPAHACIRELPSGSYRSAIGYTEVGAVCQFCGVLMEEKYILQLKPIDPDKV